MFSLRELAWMAEANRRDAWDRTAVLWIAAAEPNRDKKKHPEPFTFSDVHPFHQQSAPVMTIGQAAKMAKRQERQINGQRN